jgi:hypothetical protein
MRPEDLAEINGRVRRERLGEVRPALTVVIAETFAAASVGRSPG